MGRRFMLLMLTLASCALAAQDAATIDEKPAGKDSISQHGITWTFEKPRPAGRFVNGDWWVIGPVTVTKIDPAFDGTKNGSTVDVIANEQGYDARGACYKKPQTISTPLTVVPGTSLISTLSLDAMGAHAEYIKSAAVLTVLDQVPPANAFRPPYAKGEKPLFRLSQVKREKLPKLAPPPGKPNAEEYGAKYFAGPWLDQLQSIGGLYQNVKPADFVPAYSRDSAQVISTASLLLLVDNGKEDIGPLLVGMVQQGIDYYYLTLQKNDLWRGGSGQGNGRKWPIIFAGIMLDHEGMQHVKGFFGEDDQTYYYDDPGLPETDPYGHPERGVKGWTGAEVLWARFYDHHYDHEFLPPTKWNELGQTGNQDGCGGEGYRICCTSRAWVGQALAARLLGAVDMWNHDPFFDYVDRWMTEAFTEEQLDLLAHTMCNSGPSDRARQLGWYRTGGSKFINGMWKMHRGDMKPLKGRKREK